MTRGIRNNNPGNIRHGDPWEGRAELQPDPEFVTFTDPKWGIRAIARIMRTYRDRHGLKTIRQMITRWAPETENDTAAYVDHVASQLGLHPDEPIDLEAVMHRLIAAIIAHENANYSYPVATVEQGIALA